MATSAGAILAPEEENDAEVRREDQENINKFGRLNARLYELRAEREELKVRDISHEKRQYKRSFLKKIMLIFLKVETKSLNSIESNICFVKPN